MSALYAEERNHLRLMPGGDCGYCLSIIEIGVVGILKIRISAKKIADKNDPLLHYLTCENIFVIMYGTIRRMFYNLDITKI